MITGLLLAPARGQRPGTTKLLHPLADGRSLVAHSARALRGAVDRAVAVIQARDVSLAAQLRQCGFEVVCCPDEAGGQGASLAFGVRVTGGSTGWLVALADMPHIRPETAAAVAAQLRAGAIIAAPYFKGRRGNPVGFGRALAPQLGALAGGAGFRELIKTHRDLLIKVPCTDPGVLGDSDASEDLRTSGSPRFPKHSEEGRVL